MKPWNVTRSALRTMGGAAGPSMGEAAAKKRSQLRSADGLGVPKRDQLRTSQKLVRPGAKSNEAFVSGPVIRRVANAWRAQTGGSAVRDGKRKTLLACSGGADSTALAIALCAAVSDASSRFVIGHVVHDLRSKKESLADRNHAKKLAKWLGVPFCEAQVFVKGDKARRGALKRAQRSEVHEQTNLEAGARAKRYKALATLAQKHRCEFIATAHHLDDALETVMMRMMRGCGPRAMRGVMPVRRMNVGKKPCIVVRPMLGFETSGIVGLTRADCEALCNAAKFAWRHDATNDDTTRLRAALRKNVLPALRALDPGVARRVVRSAALCAEAGEVVRQSAKRLLKRAGKDDASKKTGNTRVFSREVLADARLPVLREALTIALRQVGGTTKRDRVRARLIGEVAKMIVDHTTHPRRLVVGACEVLVDVRRLIVKKCE
ncbi:MAG: tRNA lysidine(34) synthetase TilS [Phycisphaerales bacterium]